VLNGSKFHAEICVVKILLVSNINTNRAHQNNSEFVKNSVKLSIPRFIFHYLKIHNY